MADSNFNAVGEEALKAIWNEATNVFVAKEAGKALSTNDYTKEEKDKLQGLTKNYEELANLPTLEGEQLRGDMTFENLGFDILIQRLLDDYTPSVLHYFVDTYESGAFGDGTRVDTYTVNHMTTVNLTVVVKATPDPAIVSGTPIPIFTDPIPACYTDDDTPTTWEHLGRYTDNENVILEFSVDDVGLLQMTCLGQIPSDRTYHVTFSYVSV